MDSNEIRELLKQYTASGRYTYKGHDIYRSDLQKMLEHAEMQENLERQKKYFEASIIPERGEGLLEHIRRMDKPMTYDPIVTSEKMKHWMEEFHRESEGSFLFGIPGKDFSKEYPYTMEEAFRNPKITVRTGIQVDLEDVPYDMLPDDYIEKVDKALDSTGVEMIPGHINRKTIVVHLNEEGLVSEKSPKPEFYVSGIDPIDVSEEKKEIVRKAFEKALASHGVAVVNPYDKFR